MTKQEWMEKLKEAHAGVFRGRYSVRYVDNLISEMWDAAQEAKVEEVRGMASDLKGFDIRKTKYDAGGDSLNEVFNEGYREALDDILNELK